MIIIIFRLLTFTCYSSDICMNRETFLPLKFYRLRFLLYCSKTIPMFVTINLTGRLSNGDIVIVLMIAIALAAYCYNLFSCLKLCFLLYTQILLISSGFIPWMTFPIILLCKDVCGTPCTLTYYTEYTCNGIHQ